MNILLVENEYANRKLLEEIIDMLYPGHDVESASNGQEALAVIDRKGVDLVLTDIDMPVMDGYELLDAIKNQRNLQIPVICITAFAIKGDEEKLLEHGFDHYISKPIEVDKLELLLNEYIK